MRTLLFTLLIGFIMSTATELPAQEKKNPRKDDSYDEKVSVRFWNGKEFVKAIDDVPMYRVTDKDGTLRFWTKASIFTDGNPDKGSEIVAKDGTWVCEKVEHSKGVFHVSTVKKKPEEKKPQE